MPTISEEVRALTYDPGARRLAQVVEMLQAQVNACCGHSNSVAARSVERRGAAPETGSAQPSDPSATDSK